MTRFREIKSCFQCNSEDVHWECCSQAGDGFCDECAKELNYTCPTCGELLIPFED
jgi:predicted amidophosphoribosyltransferase